MGREIRRVPENWEHPKNDNGDYQPLYDADFDSRLKEWIDGYELWKKGEHPDQHENMKFWEWCGGPPNPEYYHTKFVRAEWFQVYETVSEGTPATPPFATKEELVEYLVQHGDFWDQNRGDGGWTREAAEQFVSVGWAPSMVMTRTADKVEIARPRDGQFPEEDQWQNV